MGDTRRVSAFNIFRRFRKAVLLKSEARDLLIDYWMGHANTEMKTRYGQQLIQDVIWRQQWAEKAGIGFELSDVDIRPGQHSSPDGQLSTVKEGREVAA